MRRCGWADRTTEPLFSYVNCQARVPKDHPLRAARRHRNGGAVSPACEDFYGKCLAMANRDPRVGNIGGSSSRAKRLQALARDGKREAETRDARQGPVYATRLPAHQVLQGRIGYLL